MMLPFICLFHESPFLSPETKEKQRTKKNVQFYWMGKTEMKNTKSRYVWNRISQQEESTGKECPSSNTACL